MYEIIIEMLEKGRHGIQLSPDKVQLVLLLFADDAVTPDQCVLMMLLIPTI